MATRHLQKFINKLEKTSIVHLSILIVIHDHRSCTEEEKTNNASAVNENKWRPVINSFGSI